jgi:hypothetical protein
MADPRRAKIVFKLTNIAVYVIIEAFESREVFHRDWVSDMPSAQIFAILDNKTAGDPPALLSPVFARRNRGISIAWS